MKTSTPLPKLRKICTACKLELSAIEFYATKHSRDGLLSRCKTCHKAAVLARQKERPDIINAANSRWKTRHREQVYAAEKRRRDNWTPERRSAKALRGRLWSIYRVTPEWWEGKLAEQSGGCAICGLLQSDTHKIFHIDHDHISGKIRGLLCHRCNPPLSRLEAIDGWAQKALAYLARYKDLAA